MTKKVKRRKFNIKKFCLFLIFLLCIILGTNYLLKLPIKNIIIKGTYYLPDELIIEASGIENYPSFLKTTKSSIENKLKNIDIIKSVEIHKKIGGILEIEIEEKKILFIERSTGKYILEDKTEEDLTYQINGIPTLINFVVDDVKDKLIEKMSEVDYEVLTKISEIEYSPTTYDEERFILYMNDENTVYITLNKIDEFKKYIDIKKQLEGKKGILYLDSGNYFEIKE